MDIREYASGGESHRFGITRQVNRYLRTAFIEANQRGYRSARLGKDLKAISPHGLKASVAAIERLSDQGSDRRSALRRRIQQMDYEAQRRFEQYNQVDLANRLVTEVLGQRWNDKLETLARRKGERDALPTTANR